MRTSDSAVYLDSSALVKLLIEEAETDALRSFLEGRPVRVSSSLARVEVERAARLRGEPVVHAARTLLATLDLIELDDEVLQRAASIGPKELRSLDAIHLGAASLFADGDFELVTYDRRMAEAALAIGMTTVAPV